MFARVALIAAIALVSVQAATAAPPRTVHMYGDSIFKGWGYGTYDNTSPLNRIDRIATMLARANGSTLRFNRTTVQAPSEICRAVARGDIKTTDSIVFENAGPHFGAAAPYQAWLEHVVKCATRYRGRGRQIARPDRLTLTTMFDYAPSYPLSTYDDALEDGRSVNQVTVQVARRSGARLIDWNARLDELTRALPELRLTHPDGIHPTVFGNIALAASILRREGVRVEDTNVLVDALMADQNMIVAAKMADPFSREQAERWVAALA